MREFRGKVLGLKIYGDLMNLRANVRHAETLSSFYRASLSADHAGAWVI